MIKLTRKQYEIEEPIQVEDESGNLLVDYIVKITPEEKLQIRDIIFDEQDVKDGRKLAKLEKEGKTDEYELLENNVLERAKARQEKFEKIVFKEERENIKQKAGESIYLDLVDTMFDFFVNAFVDKRVSQMNTLTTSLRKISNK
ncbi:hypothetical protein [uncultured Megamonas sp.]|uniref:hypothetical protein n=1 Tax=uncultured Megamonas sp. TaxID=286140 RepID=UPI00259B8704|nr:hypothetical protein [uncultured Megamonas sp.]